MFDFKAKIKGIHFNETSIIKNLLRKRKTK